MSWNWETMKNNYKDAFSSECKNDYNNQIDEAQDKEYTHFTIKNQFNRNYQNIQNDYSGTGGVQTIRIMAEIKDLMKRKKVHTYTSAYEYITKDLSSEQRTGIITHIGQIEGYEEFYNYIKEHDALYSKPIHPMPEISKEPKHEQNPVKLNWQGQSNSLIHLFRQLKNNHNKARQPLIPNSIEEVALFLKNNFECFEDVKISTIAGQLKKNTAPKKANKKIELIV